MNDLPVWPKLPYANWSSTLASLHMWTQIVGKIRMVQSPWLNHSWHVTLYVTPSGLTTGNIPHGNRYFSIEFDFMRHKLLVEECNGGSEVIALEPKDTAYFYGEVMTALRNLDVPVKINTTPNEIPNPIPFPEDRTNNSYDPDAVNCFWRALYQVDRVFNRFRAGFSGKASPSHFFWGSFDLAVTRFSGREAPDHPGGLPNMPLWVAQEAYSHEVSSAGFWPGGESYPEAIFYSYAYPTPNAFDKAEILPEAAAWSPDLAEFVLPYDAVRSADDPEAALFDFMQTTFDAAARLGSWDLEQYRRRHFPGG